MNDQAECCGWKSWAELAGIGIDGRPLPKLRSPESPNQRITQPCSEPKPAR